MFFSGFETRILRKPVWRLQEQSVSQDVYRIRALKREAFVFCRSSPRVSLFSLGFSYVGSLWVYQCDFSLLPVPVLSPTVLTVRAALLDDLEPCINITEKVFVYDRFHRDSCISPQQAASLKTQWIKNNFLGRKRVLVLCYQEEVRGFCAYAETSSELLIDLLAIHPAYQGRGLGKFLLQYLKIQYPHVMCKVGTQALNKPAIALYQSQGFDRVCVYQDWHQHF